MRRQRVGISLLVLGAGCVALTVALLGLRTDSAAGQVKGQSSLTKPVVVTVTAGKPKELAFKLSKSSLIPVGKVTFKVTNKGVLSHDFKICTAVAKNATKNSCVGKVTPMIKPGKSATLTVTLKKGQYEYLCTVAGHAAAGMKGLLGIGVKVKAIATTTTTTTKTITNTTTTTTTTTTASGPPVFPTGNASNGASVYVSAGCGNCHTLAAAHSTGTVGPDLDHQQFTVAQVENQVYYGGGDMPPFGGPNGSLTNQQIADVSTYVSQNSQ